MARRCSCVSAAGFKDVVDSHIAGAESADSV